MLQQQRKNGKTEAAWITEEEAAVAWRTAAAAWRKTVRCQGFL